MSHLRRGRTKLAPPPKLEDLELPTKRNSLTLQLSSPTKSSENFSNDVGFDEQEKKKIETLAEPYKDKPISQLPQILETTINNHYNNNATSLIVHSNLLTKSINELSDVLEVINEAKSTALKNSAEEHIVYESLKSLDVTNAKDTEDYVTQNKKKALEKLTKIYEAAAIPQEWILTLTKPKFKDIAQLDDLYKKINDIDSDYRSTDIPKILQKMPKCVIQRKESLSKYLYSFSVSFTEFMQSFLSNIDRVILFSSNKDPVKCIPNELPSKKEKCFSEDVSEHTILKAIFPYWKFIYYVRDNFTECYNDISTKYYIGCFQNYLEKILIPKINATLEEIKSKKKEDPNKKYAFYTNEQIKSEDRDFICDRLETLIQTITKMFCTESSVLSDFWEIKDNELMKLIITPKITQAFDNFVKAIFGIDPFFVLKTYSLCSYYLDYCKIDVSSLYLIPKNLWNQFISSQINSLNTSKPKRKKSYILDVFILFPKFAINYESFCTKKDKPILEKTFGMISNGVVSWLVNIIAPKYTKRKRTVLIMSNIFCLINNLNNNEKDNELNETFSTIKNYLNEEINKFMKYLINKSFTKPSEFFDTIVEWKKRNGFFLEMVQFQPTHTSDKFNDLNEKLKNTLNVGIKESFSILKRKISYEELRNELINEMIIYIKNKIEEWNKLALECYQKELTISVNDVEEEVNMRKSKEMHEK